MSAGEKKITPMFGVICDDVRIENNGKNFLIGVYPDKILVPQLPLNMGIALWLAVEMNQVGPVPFELRLLGPNGTTLYSVAAAIEVATAGRGAIPIPAQTVQLQSEGQLTFQLKEPGSDWEAVASVGVALQSTLNKPA